jgi:hypothetical protein
MGRRTSGARVGLEKIGLVQADASTLRTTQPNLGITISPDGTGTTTITSATSITGNTGITGTLSATSSFSAADGTFAGNVTITAQNQLRLREATGNGTNFLAMRAATNMTADYTITWPAAVAATNGFVLASDTSGNLTWVSAAGQVAVTDPGAVATVHYPLFGTNAGAVPTVLSPNARSNLQFVPSTGEISSTIGRYPDVIGSTAASGTLTIRGTTNATKFTSAGGSVRMTDNVASTTTTTGTLVVTGGVGVSGQVTCNALSAVSITETSSIVYKENITPIRNPLEELIRLVGVNYNRKDTKEFEAGLIAEDVNEIYPELVSKDENKNPIGIKYTKLSAYLLEGIKELYKEIQFLKQTTGVK